MLRDIYKKGPLRYPKEFHVDNGTEFKADVLKLMKEKGVEGGLGNDKVSPQFHCVYRAFQQDFSRAAVQGSRRARAGEYHERLKNLG